MNARNTVRVFEDDYGKLSSKIFRANINITASSLNNLISEETWIDNSNISSCFGLLNYYRILAFDALFVTLIQRALLQNYFNGFGDFLAYAYQFPQLQ